MKAKRPLLILLLLPIAILLLSYGITRILNLSAPAHGPFHVEVEKDIVFPWEDNFVSTIHFNETAGQEVKKPLGKTNIVLVVDNSPSMGTGEQSNFELAKRVIANFIDNFSLGENVTFGVILFGGGITGQIPLTREAPQVKDRLAAHTECGNGTNFTPALSLAAQWLDSITNENKFLVFLTDGDAQSTEPWEKYREPNRIYREHLLKNKTDVFMIGVGDGARYDVLRYLVTDDNGEFNPNRILTCNDPVKLQVVFDKVGEEIGNVTGKQGQMVIPFADQVFHWEKHIPQQTRGKYRNGIFLEPPTIKGNPYPISFPVVFARDYILHTLVEPQTWGIIKPFYREIPFSYLDNDTNPKTFVSTGIPYVLNVTYATLFWLFLPALLYFLLSRLGRKKTEESRSETVVFPNKKLDDPAVLPLKFIREKANTEWIPTLVVGLGRTGRHVLTHLKQNLADTIKEEQHPIQVFSIDVAASEVDGPQPDRVPGTITQLEREIERETEIYIPDPHLRNVKDKIQQYQNSTQLEIDNPYTYLSLEEYAALPDEVLELSSGSLNHAALARTYLYKELEQQDSSQLLWNLEEKIKRLNEQANHSDFMQIILVGNTNGGVGSGLILPLTVLLYRMAHQIKNYSKSIEIRLFLVEDRQDLQDPKKAPIINRVLMDELDLLSQAGRINIPYPLVPPYIDDDKGILKGVLRHRPYNNVYIFARKTERPQYNLFPQVGDSALFFIEKTAGSEARNVLEGVKSKEGQIRKEEKIEVLSHIASRTLMYPSGLIRENLEILFVNDIFSHQIALPGLTIQNNTPMIEKKGSLKDLLEHPLSKPILERELGRVSNKWTALLLRQDTRPYHKSLADDSENFWSFLEKALPLLLNNHVFSLTGLQDMVREIIIILKDAHSAVDAGFSKEETTEITKTLTFMETLAASIKQWVHLLQGENDDNGLLGEIQTQIKKMETLKQELTAMSASRVILGLDKDVPPDYHPDNLKKKWLINWLEVENAAGIVPELKKRCVWKIVEKGVLKPVLLFEFFGSQPYTFQIGENFKQDFMKKTHEVSEQFLAYLKEITIPQLLYAYETNAPDSYNKQNIAQRLHTDFSSQNLFYLYLLPHAACIRLNPDEENYMEQLKAECENIKAVEEVIFYPPSSNQYRLFTLQVSTLLRGDPKQSWEEFKPLHITEKLKNETQRMIEHKFGISVSPLLPFHYLSLTNHEYFKKFVNLWLGGKINKDDYDGLWKLQEDGKAIHLTFFKNDGLEEAAVGFVMNFHRLPVTPKDVPAQKERLEKMQEQANKRNPFFCWMKLHMEKIQ